MDKLVDQLFIFEGNGEVKGFIGTYNEYRELKEEENKQLKKEEAGKKSIKKEDKKESNQEKKKLSFKDRFEYENIESEIALLEQEKEKLESLLNNPDTPYEKLQDLTNQLGKTMELIDSKTLRWLELDEMANA